MTTATKRRGANQPDRAAPAAELPEPDIYDGCSHSQPEFGRGCDGYGPSQMRAFGDARYQEGYAAALRRPEGVDDLESDIDTLASHNAELQSVILDAIQLHASFGTTADMADWLRESLEAAALQPEDAK